MIAKGFVLDGCMQSIPKDLLYNVTNLYYLLCLLMGHYNMLPLPLLKKKKNLKHKYKSVGKFKIIVFILIFKCYCNLNLYFSKFSGIN